MTEQFPTTLTIGRGVACKEAHATADGGKAVPFTKTLELPCHVREGEGGGEGEGGLPINLYRFLLDRLPKPAAAVGSKPCLAENWFIDDATPLAPGWITEADLRRIWRVARLQRIGLERGAGCSWLLFHQVAQLLPAIIGASSSIAAEQVHARAAA